MANLDGIQDALRAIALSQNQIVTAVEGVSQRVQDLEKKSHPDSQAHGAAGAAAHLAAWSATPLASGFSSTPPLMPANSGTMSPPLMPANAGTMSPLETPGGGAGRAWLGGGGSSSSTGGGGGGGGASSSPIAAFASSRIVLTTYPKQIGIKPLPMEWGKLDPYERGPVAVSRAPSTIRRRNAIGAHGGSYSIYYALAVASHELDPDHRPSFKHTEPAVPNGPFPQWGDPSKIVSMDPFGHVVPTVFKDMMEKEDLDLRPTIAITRAHMTLPEMAESVAKGRLVPDGKVCINSTGELNVTKYAVEPVWHLPGVAERFGIDERTLRRSLFEYTGGMYPELITRGDIKVFLPPIGGLTVYCFGNPANMSDPTKRLTLRVHDECNGSDVFGSDICTCRPYLIYGIEEAVKEAQNGGSGVVIYFRKEGRALGEVTKYLVYNARKRGEDLASEYFKRTEDIAGVKDMRFQALMPDILHWLGIQKIDRMMSMSNMKHDAIVNAGIPILQRCELPDELIPEDSKVEIGAKITAGYFTTGKRMSEDELKSIHGRVWEDIDH